MYSNEDSGSGSASGDGVKVANNADFFVCNASIVGNKNRVWGHRNTVTGNGNQVCGNWNCVTGDANSVKGINNRVVGVKNDVLDGRFSSSTGSSTSSTPEEVDDNQQDEHDEGVEVLVSVCKRVRVRTDASGRRSCEKFHVELVERRPLSGGGVRGGSGFYDLSGLDGADSDAPDEASAAAASANGGRQLPTCAVCLSRERCVKLAPCRHVPVCLACARRLFGGGARVRSVACPLCRCPVESVERLFLG